MMFKKLSLLALVAPLVTALTVEVPQNPRTSSSVTIRWNSQAGDPATFSIYLVNEVFHDSFGIANNVVPELGEITLVLPVVPARDGYTINLVDVGNMNNVYASTSTFSIAELGASTTSSGTSSSTPSTSTTGRSTSTSPTSSIATTPRPTNTSSGFGVTVTPPSTNSATNSTSSGEPSASASSAASVPLKMNTNVGAFAAVVISAIAGAVVVAL